MIYEQVIACDS